MQEIFNQGFATITLSGHITALEPLTVSMPGVTPQKGRQGEPTHRLPRNGTQDSATAYWPATTIRGSLRHAAHRLAILKVRKGQNTGEGPFDLAQHFLLAQGVDIVGDVAEVGQETLNVNQKLDDGDDPQSELFGYWKRAGKLCVANAYPEDPAHATAFFGGGARCISFERSPNLLNELGAADTDRLTRILTEQSEASEYIQGVKNQQRALRASMKGMQDAEDRKKVFDQINELDAQITARKDEKPEARESIRRPIDGYEAIVAGTQLSHRMTLRGGSELDLGFLLASLRELSRDSHMGGHLNHGCGLTAGQYTVKTWLANEEAPRELGTVSFGPDGFEMKGEALEAALAVWAASAPTFSRKTVELPKPKEEKAKGSPAEKKPAKMKKAA